MSDSENPNPRLRLIDTQPITYEGTSYLLLRDPLALTDKTLLIPQPIIPVLAFIDGEHTPGAIRAALALRYGLFLTVQRIKELIDALDDGLLLDNDRSRHARAVAQVKFRHEPFRPPANAGVSYPEDPDQLAAYLQAYFDELHFSKVRNPAPAKNGGEGNTYPPTKINRSTNGGVRGVISPHIDYERGGSIYAEVWDQAAEAARAAELVVIFGTDHFSEGHPVTLTRQSYATPFGVLPTHTVIVDELADALGVEEAFAGELHHRREHSIELAAVWLHYVREGKPVELVPVLCGGLGSGDRASGFNEMEDFLAILHRVIGQRKTLVVAAGDLAHVGPAFGGEPVNPVKLILLKQADDELIESMCSGDAQGFYNAIQRVQDENNVCGVSPIYLTLRLLGGSLTGQNHGYLVCPADEQKTSVVTICGITLQ